MDDDPREQVRVLACDLAEHVVQRAGDAAGFAVWVDDGDVQSLTETAQRLFDRVSERIERELFAYVDVHGDEAVVVDALDDVVDNDVVRRALARLQRRQ
jgi:hypothetical protein